MPKLIYIDSETCGLYGMPVLIQYAVEDGPIQIYDIWKHTVKETKELIEYFCENIFVGFNNTFDWFMLSKLYTIWDLCPDEWLPEEHIEEIAYKEPLGRDGVCIKPYSAMDLLLHSRKGPYQALMARKEIRIRRIPNVLADELANVLEDTIELDGIYFAKTVDPLAPKWKALDILSKSGTVNPDFKDVVLKFHPAGGLKYLAEYALGLTPKNYFSDVEPDKKFRPVELGFAPYALAVAEGPDWICYENCEEIGKAWPALIKEHINHWATNEEAREYAYDDVVYTRELYKHFGCPEVGDVDSILACMVASVRWHGFTYNREGLEKLREEALEIIEESPVNVNQHRAVFAYMDEVMSDQERLIIEESTGRPVLESISEWYIDEEETCLKCLGLGFDEDKECVRCKGEGVLKVGQHPAAIRAKNLLEIKIASKEVELYNKLLTTDRFHASFNIIGTLSSRMSGADGLNPQGIKHDKTVRKQFQLAWPGMVLCGGDFDSFEVTIADAVFQDDVLHKTLLDGKKFHGLLGVELFPGHTYEDILASDGQAVDFYSKAKSGTFGFLYGGDASTWNKKLGVPMQQAEKAFDSFCAKYKGVGSSRDRIADDFCSMQQPGGLGSQVVWKDPKEYCETFLGFKRYFTLENKICKALFGLAQKLPKEWRNLPGRILRRDREQTPAGAVSSALYGAAFQIQAANMRAANNHLIQSPGAEITKAVQKQIWDIQPHGVHELVVAPMNIHDEILCVTNPDFVELVAETVQKAVESFRKYVPLIGMKWNLAMDNWAEKKHTAQQLHITYER